MQKYLDRYQAGKVLAEALRQYANQKDVFVLALPRGGVPVAYEIAKALNLPLDVLVVRKLGVPDHQELAMGAIATGGAVVINDNILQELHITKQQLNHEIAQEQAELNRRERIYRGEQLFPNLKTKTVILVDDGIATGATMKAAIKALHTLGVNSIVVAVPVADQQMAEAFSTMVAELICPMQVTPFYAVGAWYEDFSQTEDQEVYTLLTTLAKKDA